MSIQINQENIHAAVKALNRGGVIIFPTDTVYGVGCKIDHIIAIEKIYNIKARPLDRPLQILLSDVADCDRYAASISDYARRLMEAWMPGGITLLFQAVEGLPARLVGANHTVGLRVPDAPDLQGMIAQIGGTLAATSANLSGGKSPWSVEEIPKEILSQVDYVLDAGVLPSCPASTVLDCTGSRPRLVREGAISMEQLSPFGVQPG